MISEQAKQRMRELAAHYPVARSAVMPALYIAQQEAKLSWQGRSSQEICPGLGSTERLDWSKRGPQGNASSKFRRRKVGLTGQRLARTRTRQDQWRG